jgi:hypothetical protein
MTESSWSQCSRQLEAETLTMSAGRPRNFLALLPFWASCVISPTTQAIRNAQVDAPLGLTELGAMIEPSERCAEGGVAKAPALTRYIRIIDRFARILRTLVSSMEHWGRDVRPRLSQPVRLFAAVR